MSIVIVHDAIGANVGHLPPGQAAGYVTGSSGIPWTSAQLAAHPGTVLIDQSPNATTWDATADVDDFERGAVTLGELAERAKERQASYKSARRPGQRMPAVYASASNITPVANALIAGGVTSGVGLWVANWSVTEAQAQWEVENAAGPFPIIGWQFASLAYTDVSVFSNTWLFTVSSAAAGGHVYEATAGQTLGELAASRGMDVFSWLDLQRRLNSGDAEYLAGNAAAKAGSKWRTVH